MDILSTWLGRLAVFLLAFPVVMLGVPFLIATVRQRLTWDKRQPADAGLPEVSPEASGGQGEPALDDLLRRGRNRRYTV